MPPQTNSQFPNSTLPILNQNKKDPKFILLVILGLILIAINLCFLYKTHFQKTEPTEQQNLVVDVSSNWKTYRNDEYGFEFKYPKDWKISQDLENIEKKEDEGHLPFKDLSVYVLDNERELDYINFVKNYEYIGSGFNWVGEEGDLVNIFILNERFDDESLNDIEEKVEDREDGSWVENVKDISVGGFKAKRFIYRKEHEGSSTMEVIKIEKPGIGNGFINIKIHYNDGKYRKDVFDQILSTFKFISTSTEAINIKNWKVYTDDEYGFQFEYPDVLDNKVRTYKDDTGRKSILIEYYSNNILASKFEIWVLKKTENLSLTEYFNKNIDTTGSLIKEGNFVLHKIPGNGEMYALTDAPLNMKYLESDQGPICSYFAMPETKKYLIFSSCPGEGMRLNFYKDYNLTERELRDKIMLSLKFTK